MIVLTDGFLQDIEAVTQARLIIRFFIYRPIQSKNSYAQNIYSILTQSASLNEAANNAGQTGVTTLVVGTYGEYYNMPVLDAM